MEFLLLIILIFCVVLLCVFTFWVPRRDVRYHFRIATMFVSFHLKLFVGRLVSHLRYLCVKAHSGVQHILCFCFVFLRRMYHIYMLPVFLDCFFFDSPFDILFLEFWSLILTRKETHIFTFYIDDHCCIMFCLWVHVSIKLFKLAWHTYCYSDSRKLWAVMKGGGLVP